MQNIKKLEKILKKIERKNIDEINRAFQRLINNNKSNYNETIGFGLKPLGKEGYQINIVALVKGYPQRNFSSWIESNDGRKKIIDFMEKYNIKKINYENQTR